MSGTGDLEWYGLASGVVMVGAGVYGILRPHETAQRNNDFIESGKETYFEQRRAWKHYPSTRPETDPDQIRRLAWFAVAGGVVLLLLYSPISIFHWG